MNQAIRLSLSFALLLIATHRLPAPILEVPETASPSPTATPSGSQSRNDRDSPENAVSAYFDCLNRRDVLSAYQLFSSRFRSRNSFKQYEKTFASTPSIHVLRLERFSLTAVGSSVFAEFEELRSPTEKAHWSGTIDLVREGQNWRIDSMRGLKSDPR
jgi:hypothetical protein